MKSLAQKLVSSALWSTAEAWGRQGATFIIFIVLARGLGPEAFGFAALAMVAPVICAVPVTRGISDAIIQRRDIDPLHLDSAFWLLAGIGVVLSAAIWGSAALIAAAFDQPLLEDLVRWTSVIVAVQALGSVPAAILKRELHFRLFAIRTLVSSLAGGCIGITMAAAGYGVWSLVGMQIAKTGLESAILLGACGWRPRLRYSQRHVGELWSFGGPIVVQSLWTFVNDELPKVIIGTMIGPYAVGIYAFARRPLDLLSEVILNPLLAIAMPAVSRLQDDAKKLDRFFDMSMRMSTLVGTPVFVGFAAIAPVLVPLVFGETWQSAVLTVQILMLLGVQRTIDGLCAYTLLALGHSRLILGMNILYTVLCVAIIPFGALLGIETVAAAIVLCNFLLVIPFLYLTQRHSKVDISAPLRLLPRIGAAACLMFIAVTAWQLGIGDRGPALVAFVSGVVVGVVAYGSMVLLVLRPDLLSARETLLRHRG